MYDWHRATKAKLEKLFSCEGKYVEELTGLCK
jgi:hypothetical protein